MTRRQGAGRPDLSVIVVTHNGREKALAALESGLAAAGQAEVEWFVVDSGSTDGTLDAIVARWPEIRLFRRDNVGFAAANNVALREARGRYLLLMNPDVEIAEGTLADLVAALDVRPEVGAASALQVSPQGAVLPSIGRFPTMGRQLGEALLLSRLPGLRFLQEMETRTDRYAEERSADWLVGAFLAVRAEAANEVGGLDERFFLYSEEKDWCFRIRAAGWDVRHLPVLRVVHHTGGYDRPGLKAQLTYSKLLFAQKHFGPVRRSGIRLGLLTRHAVRTLASTARRRPDRSHERQALALALGRGEPPFGRPAP